MPVARPWPRRAFLAAGVLLAAGAGASAWGLLRARRARREAVARLAKVLGDPATAVPIGETYLAGRPEARQPGRLASELLSEMDGPARLATDEELRAEVGRRVRSDFEAGRTVRVGGWILSSTEARLAALAALSAAPAAAASPAGP